MRRHIVRTTLLIVAGAWMAGVGLLRWTGESLPPESDLGTAPSADLRASPSPTDSGSAPPEPMERLERREAGSPRASSAAAGPEVRALPAEASLVVSLPPASSELMPDGLPASALRCAFDGGAVSCGNCLVDGDCPPGQGCVANRETRRYECMASECEEDVHCFPGFVCRAVTTGSTGALIRRCTPEGLRREGEPCDLVPLSAAGTCQEGLRCIQGACARPCRLEDPRSCPEGHVCKDSPNGPGCFADCRELGCESGQRCKRLGDSEHQCLVAVHGSCPETPCAEGERCNMRLARGRGVFWCARPCNPLLADSCPSGEVCGLGGATASTCFRGCEPMVLDSCGEGWRCTSVSEDMSSWGCAPQPDW